MPFHMYLFFAAGAGEAMEHYRAVFGGELEVMTNGDLPEADRAPDVDPALVMHATLALPDGSLLMASDDPDGATDGHSGFAVSWTAPDAERARAAFTAISAGGAVLMPIEETFWSPAFGMATDRFGVRWMIDCAPAEATAQ